MNLTWALHRLSAMSGRELCHRAKQQFHARLEQFGMRNRPPGTPLFNAAGRPWVHPFPSDFDTDRYSHAADRILAGNFDVFALRPAPLGFPPRWNRDPKTGKEAPMVFGKALDYRNEALVGDIKCLWEPSRHAELVTLAQAWRLTRDDRYSEGCRTLLESWFKECPYPLGPHWVSSLELAVRLLNWSFAWRLLGGADSPLFESSEGRGFRDRWLASIYRHCHFIAGYLSRYSSANNHLLGELTGLFVAGLTWPCWAESLRWIERARRELEEQALLQNGPDGVNREQAVWYHHEVADMMIIAGLVGRANGLDFGPGYWRRLEAMLEFLASIMDAGGNVPAFGDADDAVIARLDPDEHASAYMSLLAAGSVLFERPAFAFKARRFDDKARWLLGDAAADRFYAMAETALSQPPMRRAFTDAGYYVLGGHLETPDEVRIVFDAGPLGYQSIAAHGHADALSFTLSAGGVELLIDPGTFAYHTQKRWRDYFRGTSAHNTVRVDGHDQSRSGGNFLWLTHARARVLELSSDAACDRIVAEHDGYQRLADPVLHRRELRIDRLNPAVTVVDELLCSREHDLEIFWHFAEQCAIEAADNRLSIRRDDVELTMTLPMQARCEIFRGSEEPVLGWNSRRFDERVACCSVRAAVRIQGDTRLVTHMSVRFRRAPASSVLPHCEQESSERGAPVARREARAEEHAMDECGSRGRS
ncbi:MAG: alginate lyase family protein [Steroidobacter sp.]